MDKFGKLYFDYRESEFLVHSCELFMFPDYLYMFGMSSLPQSFQPPHLQPPMLGPIHHPNYAALLQGPHLWVPTITPFGPILVLQVVEIDVLVLSDINLLQPLLPTLTAPPQVPTMRCPAPQANPSFCPWRPWEEKTTSSCHQVLRFCDTNLIRD